jgi:hypothetical protein
VVQRIYHYVKTLACRNGKHISEQLASDTAEFGGSVGAKHYAASAFTSADRAVARPTTGVVTTVVARAHRTFGEVLSDSFVGVRCRNVVS